jgi:UDP-N-acetylglucosamine--N-acetylmuramyl-(pentapeptide) pyrophosphoryl-undecaprenol N-acetylglucosamine transferase
MHRAPRILLAGGGSGGSATPVIAVAERLRELSPACELLLVGTREGPERGLAAAAGLSYAGVSSGKLRRYWSFQNFVDPVRVASGLIASLRLVRRFDPDVGFGAGGFASVPPLAATALLHRPIHIHQQDAERGLANRLLTPLARSCSVSLPASFPHFPLDRTVLTGNPVRPSILAGCAARAVDAFGLEAGVPLLLVTGGGTGALGLNRLVLAAVPHLTSHFQVVHLTGRGRALPTTPGLSRYHQREFVTSEMADLLAAATLVVTRAGMGILSELSALGKPAVLIPMPGSHQAANAAHFAGRGAALVLEQDRLSGQSLAAALAALLADHARLSELGENMRRSMPADAVDRVARLVLGLADKLN